MAFVGRPERGVAWLLWVIVVAGCGGGAPEPIQPSQRQTLVEQPVQIDEEVQKAAPAPPPAAVPSPASNVKKGEEEGPAEASPTPIPDKQTPRPAKISDWKQEDFLSAKRENDPKLIEAVVHFGTRNVGQSAAAALLREVLKAAEPKGKSQGEGGWNQSANTQVVQTLIAVLASNKTEEAQQVLRDIVTGALKTDDDRTATAAALGALARQPSEKNDALLLRALTEPDKLRSAGAPVASSPTAPMPQKPGEDPPPLAEDDASATMNTELQQQAQQVIEQRASEEFRVKLAAYLLSLDGGDPRIQQFCPIIEKPRPDNVAAQLVMYQNRKPPQELKLQFERYFTEYSSTALGYVLGVLAEPKKTPMAAAPVGTAPSPSAWGAPGGGWGGTSERKNEKDEDPDHRPQSYVAGPSDAGNDPDLVYGAARKLWEPKVASIIGGRVAQITTLKEPSQVFSLARTMPLDSIRARLFTLLKAKFDDGPDSLFTVSAAATQDPDKVGTMGSISGGALRDPGFHVVVKMLPREGNRRGARPRPARPAPREGEEKGKPAAVAGGESVEPRWMAASETLLRETCAQCQTAAARGAGAAATGTMPIEPHADAKIACRYDLKLPENAPEELAGFPLDPIEVHYVRIEESAQPAKLLAYYRRVTKVKHREVGNNAGAWFDTVTAAATPGRKLSIDVLITRAERAVAPSPESEATPGRPSKKVLDEPLVIEILTIEIKDPTSLDEKAEDDATEKDKKAEKKG